LYDGYIAFIDLTIFFICSSFGQWRKVWKKRWVALHGMEIVYMDKEPTSKNMGDITITKAQFTGAPTDIHSVWFSAFPYNDIYFDLM
jgi:hypothetical protein